MVVTRTTLAVVLTVLALMASGCTDGGSKESTDPLRTAAPAEFDESTGGIQGMVVDEEFVPVEAVQVGLLGLATSTLTDGGGRFSLSHIAPGEHQLSAVRIGYQAATVGVTVRAGSATEVDAISLTRLAVEHAFHETHIQRGLFGCGLSWAPGTPPPPLPGTQEVPKVQDPTGFLYDGNATDGLPNRIGGVAGCGVLDFFNDTAADTITQFDQFSLDWEVAYPTEDWKASVFEMRWTSNQLAGRGLSMIWEVDRCFNTPPFMFATANGVGPLYVHAGTDVIEGVLTNSTTRTDLCNDGPEDCNADVCKILSRVFATRETTGSDAADVGVSFQQSYELFHSFFMFAPVEEGWSAVELE